MTINERFVKLSSRVPFPEDINLGDDVRVTINNQEYTYNCVSTQDKDNQDSTVDRVYILKCLIE